MPAFADLSLNDSAPAAITFKPTVIDSSGVAKWITNVESVFDARRTATLSVALPKNGSSVARVKHRVIIPVMDAADTTKKLAEAYVNIEFVVPKLASSTQRADLLAFAKNFLGHAAATAAVTNFESQY